MRDVICTKEEYQALLIELFSLRDEIKCLRSVLSEFPGDKSEYVQMRMANIHRDGAINARAINDKTLSPKKGNEGQ